MKWKDRGHPSQHKNRPIPRHAEQKSWLGCGAIRQRWILLRIGKKVAVPLTTSGSPLVRFFLPWVVPSLIAPPTLTPLPEADTPVRTPTSLPRVGRSLLSNPSAASRMSTSPSAAGRGPITSCNASGRASDGGGGAKMERGTAPRSSVDDARGVWEGAGEASAERPLGGMDTDGGEMRDRGECLTPGIGLYACERCPSEQSRGRISVLRWANDG
jgi:hypothetical protein